MNRYDFPLTTSQQLFNQQYAAIFHNNQLSRNLVSEYGFHDTQDGRPGNREDVPTGYELYDQTTDGAVGGNSLYNQEALIMTQDGHTGSELYGQEIPSAAHYGSEMPTWIEETPRNVPGTI